MVKFKFYDPDDEKAGHKTSQPAPSVPSAAMTTSAPQASAGASQSKSGFTLHWIHELGWRMNPFTELRAKPAHVYVVNQDTARTHINLFFIKEKQFGTISGGPGSGKTFMLSWLAEELQPYGDRFCVCGFDGSAAAETVISKVCSPFESFLSKYKGESPEELSAFIASKAKRRLVILVDNAENIPEKSLAYYKQLLTQNQAIVIFAGQSPPKISADDLQVTLAHLTPQDCEKILERRIAAAGGRGIEPFNSTFVAELWKASKNSLNTFMSLCNETAMKIALKQFVPPPQPEPVTPAMTSAATEKAPKQKAAKSAPPTVRQEEQAQKRAYDDFISGLLK